MSKSVSRHKMVWVEFSCLWRIYAITNNSSHQIYIDCILLGITPWCIWCSDGTQTTKAIFLAELFRICCSFWALDVTHPSSPNPTPVQYAPHVAHVSLIYVVMRYVNIAVSASTAAHAAPPRTPGFRTCVRIRLGCSIRMMMWLSPNVMQVKAKLDSCDSAYMAKKEISVF